MKDIGDMHQMTTCTCRTAEFSADTFFKTDKQTDAQSHRLINIAKHNFTPEIKHSLLESPELRKIPFRYHYQPHTQQISNRHAYVERTERSCQKLQLNRFSFPPIAVSPKQSKRSDSSAKQVYMTTTLPSSNKSRSQSRKMGSKGEPVEKIPSSFVIKPVIQEKSKSSLETTVLKKIEPSITLPCLEKTLPLDVQEVTTYNKFFDSMDESSTLTSPAVICQLTSDSLTNEDQHDSGVDSGRVSEMSVEPGQKAKDDRVSFLPKENTFLFPVIHDSDFHISRKPVLSSDYLISDLIKEDHPASITLNNRNQVLIDESGYNAYSRCHRSLKSM